MSRAVMVKVKMKENFVSLNLDAAPARLLRQAIVPASKSASGTSACDDLEAPL
jgi:hypothetical protein